MSKATLSAPMSGGELAALRKGSGFRRTSYCGALGITTRQLSAFENDEAAIPPDVARLARVLDGQGAEGKRVGIATFGDQFVVVRLSLIQDADCWRADVLPILHDNRASAVLAARDFAALHGYEFVPIGF